MSVPFYVPPEQMIKDKADYARKNIAKGRDLIACSAAEGIVIVTENQFRTLYKISEIYDRIAFGGVGKYNEFENLRVLGVRQADLKGYQFSREDVGARALANAYGQTLGQVFTHEMKPYEVEILLAEVGITPAEDKLYHITYDGTVMDEEGCTVLGGQRGDHRRRARHALPAGHGGRRRDPALRRPARGPGDHTRSRSARGRDPRPRPRPPPRSAASKGPS